MVLIQQKLFAVIAHCGDKSRLLSLNRRKNITKQYAALWGANNYR